ncbi:hypothetical protein U9M48_041125 [Paspalum notatum var. saurae]|uniref:Large ribosomal subunit protein mL45 n=1 Tax=Paspalum notatum var. saurae TaxID=547442 RepID=A0AAQ3UPN9_PASNO
MVYIKRLEKDKGGHHSRAVTSRFAAACGTLSQYVKAAEAERWTRTRPTALVRPPAPNAGHQRRSGRASRSGSAADHYLRRLGAGARRCPADRAADLLRLAAADEARGGADQLCFSAADLLVVRKASLQCFMEKRKGMVTTARAELYRQPNEECLCRFEVEEENWVNTLMAQGDISSLRKMLTDRMHSTIKNELKRRQSMWHSVHWELLEPAVSIRTLRARMIGLDKNDLDKAFIQLTLEFVTKQKFEAYNSQGEVVSGDKSKENVFLADPFYTALLADTLHACNIAFAEEGTGSFAFTILVEIFTPLEGFTYCHQIQICCDAHKKKAVLCYGFKASSISVQL